MPTFSERLADALAAHGLTFTPGSTGGNCMALMADTPTGGDFLITNGDAGLPDGDGEIYLGDYAPALDGEAYGAIMLGDHSPEDIARVVAHYLTHGQYIAPATTEGL